MKKTKTHKCLVRDFKKVFQKENVIYLFYPLTIFYMEMVVKIACFGQVSPKGILYTGLFSITIGLACTFACNLFKHKTNWILSVLLLTAIALLCGAQIIYFKIFDTFGTLYSLFVGAGAITEFWSATFEGIKTGIIPLCFLFLPYILFIIYGKRILPSKRLSKKALVGIPAGTVVAHLIAVVLVINGNSGVMPVSYLYRDAFIPYLSVDNFGVITTLRLDAQNLLFGSNRNNRDKLPKEKEEPLETTESVYNYNVTEIDFDTLIENETDEAIKDLHKYFKNVVPTKQNEYTGLFKGKNLIWIVGEAFSSLALNEEVTPTLYKLANEGFVFNNFYNPVWSVSTSDGEYVTLTGLIPKSGIWSFKRSARNEMPYCFGNLLTPLGYTCKAYHNHYYNYYGRDLSHPNMGYDYKGLGNGLKVKEVWPESDLEMMELTIPEDIKQKPFHNYYMTVSGHLNYTFDGNNMANRHKKIVNHLDYSEGCKAYLACNVELDLAMSYILEQLKEAGELENTVIVLSGDHYPYGLTEEEMDELAGHELEKKYEIYKSTLIIWSGSMKEPVKVDKVCSSLDVMPTLANLMGISYESRLLMGQDILSDSPGLVEFNDRSWVTDLGKFDAKINVFKPNNGINVKDGYAREIQSRVNNAFEYSAKILEKNYYSKVLVH